MKQGSGLLVLAVLVAVLLFLVTSLVPEQHDGNVTPADGIGEQAEPRLSTHADASTDPERVVLDISVHTEEALRVLFDRAGQLAEKLQPAGQEASIVLVLHGPEVEFFSTRNYDSYREIVDQAARLDALEIVDVKICQTMMKIHGVERDDIPSFIEQVPLGPAEVDRLVREGYVYF
jgi:intracellular sulfur oxidation DsrE/DsrF family protein